MASQSFDYRGWLRWLLLAIGIMLMLAFLAIFFPVSLMAWCHEKLGLGPFPDQPIVIYLARSTSLMYAVHGFLTFLVALNYDRYFDLVPVFGWLHFGMGLVMLGTDLNAGMPLLWTAAEGGPIAAAGLLIVWMWRNARKQEPRSNRWNHGIQREREPT